MTVCFLFGFISHAAIQRPAATDVSVTCPNTRNASGTVFDWKLQTPRFVWELVEKSLPCRSFGAPTPSPMARHDAVSLLHAILVEYSQTQKRLPLGPNNHDRLDRTVALQHSLSSFPTEPLFSLRPLPAFHTTAQPLWLWGCYQKISHHLQKMPIGLQATVRVYRG